MYGAVVSVVVVFVIVLTECYYFEDNTRPRYLTAAVGDSVVFNCEIDFPQSFPIPYRLYWKRKGKVIYSWQDGQVTEADEYVGRIALVTKIPHRTYGMGSINLTSVRESDAGWFECRTLFPNRTPAWRNNGTWFHLTVSGGNLLAIPPLNKTVLEGDEVEFTCLTKDFEIRVKWFKDGISLSEYHDLINRSWVTKDNSLMIRPTDSGDTGEYECEASNAEQERQTARAYLNVQYKAKVVYAPPEIHLPYGRPALLDCHYRANPPLTNLRWDKDGFLFDPYNIQGVFYRRNGSLYISKVDESHNGIYTCTPYNDLGSAGASTNMHVIVQKPPIFVKTPHNLYLRKLGESVEMTCDATDGEDGHKPLIVWYKVGTAYEMMVLCKDDNGDGFFSKSILVWTKDLEIEPETSLKSKYPPVGFPRNVTVHPTDDGLLVEWLKPEYGLEFLKWYIVRWTKNNDEYFFGSADTTNTSYLITSLAEGTEYDIQVVALSIDDQQSVSGKVKGTFPGFKSLRAVATGIIAGLAFLAVAFVAVFYIKKKWFRAYPQISVKT
uniref:Protein borderless n=1 Tax=Diabrotica virgifera virgifera TaxID=50390 RepID=A0A6P7FQ61_DIAVI